LPATLTTSPGGNGGARTFFSEPDYGLYRDLLGEHCRAASVAVWARRFTVKVHLIDMIAEIGDDAIWPV
jgi:hypothetical protein